MDHIPIVTAWNKIDACTDPEGLRQQLLGSRSSGYDSVCLSGATGEGVPDLLAMIAARLEESMIELEVLLPYASGVMRPCGAVFVQQRRTSMPQHAADDKHSQCTAPDLSCPAKSINAQGRYYFCLSPVVCWHGRAAHGVGASDVAPATPAPCTIIMPRLVTCLKIAPATPPAH